MATNKIFNPSTNVTIVAGGLSQSFSLGTIDASNMSMTLTNNGPSTAFFDFAAAIDVNRGGVQTLQVGQSVLLTNAGSMTSIAAQTINGGATIVAQRGSVAVQETF
jgi:hypothetical protein